MRPLFAIAPLALAFVLLGPTTAEVSSPDSPSLVAKVWHLVFGRDDAAGSNSPTQIKPTSSLNQTSALRH